MSEQPFHLPPDALRDFEIECEEHIVAARETLLSLETVPDLALIGREPLDVLFRAFHSIKGLSGMVGAQAIERAAHDVETYLGAIRTGKRLLTEEGVTLLVEAVGLLEASCAAIVSGVAPVESNSLRLRIASLLDGQPAEIADQEPVLPAPVEAESSPQREKQLRISTAYARGDKVWNVTFAPSPQLSARGINVNSIRETLKGLGEILDAEPVPAAGGIQFRFLLATAADVDPASALGDGVIIAPHEVSIPVAESQPDAVAPARHSKLVRVELSRLDDLMTSVADLVITRGQLQGRLARVRRYLPVRERRELQETTEAIERQLRHLREKIMRVRMVPVRDLFLRMRLVVRDLTRETGKELELVFQGEETEVDKLLVERMADPLLHLIRNAVSHGIESVEERRSAGKSDKGRITIRAATSGGMIVLEVEDDGRGIEIDHVVAKARASGLIPPTATPDPAAVLDLLCTPGFSTRETADRVSGRGVGMDIVRLTVESLGGSLMLDSRPGRGSRFTCRLPLTLMVADVLTVSAGGQTYAVSKTLIREVVPVSPESIVATENHELLKYRSGVLPMLRLSDLFGAARPVGEFVALITGEGASAVAFAIDRAMGLHEVVIRALVDPLLQVAGFSGATDLGDGRPILILDPAGLSRRVRQRQNVRVPASRG